MLTVVREQDLVQEQLEKLGIALRDARLRMNLTQGEVGERAGVSRQLVSRIEQGLNGEVSAYVAVAMASGLQFALVEQADRPDGGADYINTQGRLI